MKTSAPGITAPVVSDTVPHDDCLVSLAKSDAEAHSYQQQEDEHSFHVHFENPPCLLSSGMQH